MKYRIINQLVELLNSVSIELVRFNPEEKAVIIDNNFEDRLLKSDGLISYYNKLSHGDYFRRINDLTTSANSKFVELYDKSKVKYIEEILENLEDQQTQINIVNRKKDIIYSQSEIKDVFGEDKSAEIEYFKKTIGETKQQFIDGLKRILENGNPSPSQKGELYFSKKMRYVGKAFCWNKDRDRTEDMVKLHTFLRENEFIENDTPISKLDEAFNCSLIYQPLGIKWIKPVKGKTSKSLLFHFIDQLERLRFIEVTYQNSILFSTIKGIFSDRSGEELKNLAVSRSNWLNQRITHRTPQEFELDMILSSITR